MPPKPPPLGGRSFYFRLNLPVVPAIPACVSYTVVRGNDQSFRLTLLVHKYRIENRVACSDLLHTVFTDCKKN